MMVLCILLAMLSLFLSLKLIYQRKLVQKVKKQIDFLIDRDTQTEIMVEKTDGTILDLAASINHLLKKYRSMGQEIERSDTLFRDTITSLSHTNFQEGVATWCYFDEFHVLLRDPLTASYFVAVWKMLRKKGCVPSALTQNVKDLLASREIENILDNTDFMILLSQAQSDRAILARQLGISEHQLSYITHSNSGEGLLFYGNVTIPFVDRFPKGEIYDLLTTRPEDMKNEAKTE